MMKLHIARPYVTALVDVFPELAHLGDQLRFGTHAEVGFAQLPQSALAHLQSLYAQAGSDMDGHAAQIATLRQAINDDSERFGADDLERLLPALAEYLVRDGIRGWLFRATPSGKPMAYVITRLDYTPPGEEEAGRILIELKANGRGRIAVEQVVIRSRDLADRTVAEVLASKGYLKETAALIAGYDESSERYFAWRADYGRQFAALGTGYYAEDPSATHRNTDWSRKNKVVLSTTGSPARLVNDESILITSPTTSWPSIPRAPSRCWCSRTAAP
jgi:hypothetical protein